MASRTHLRADYLFPGDGDVIADAWLVIEDGLIADLGSADHDVDVDLGRSAIIPPLVNAHTHLEFSDLAKPIPAGGDFSQWIEAVIDNRVERTHDDADSVAAISRGLEETQRYGCCQVAEIATTAWNTTEASTVVGGIQFLELLGIDAARIDVQVELAKRFLAAGKDPASRNFRRGLSPHAPYSTSMALVEAAVALARGFDVPVAMHLAETKEELQLLQGQSGPLADFLVRRGIWPPPHITGPTRPMDYLQRLADAPRALIIHGNYLTSEERAFLAARPHMSVVYCPRTHAHFGHPRYPLAELLDAGVRVALGTDSRASNPDLNLWAEAQFVARHHLDVSPAQVLQMVTTASAEALLGTPTRLQPGAAASFSVVGGLSGDREFDPFTKLLSGQATVAGAWVEGTRVAP